MFKILDFLMRFLSDQAEFRIGFLLSGLASLRNNIDIDGPILIFLVNFLSNLLAHDLLLVESFVNWLICPFVPS